MATALGFDLVLDVNAGGARLNHFADGLRGAAPTRVGVHEQRQGSGSGNALHVDEHVRERGDAEVGQAVRRSGDARARKVKRAETGFLREQRGVGVDDANDLKRAFRLKRGSQTCAG